MPLSLLCGATFAAGNGWQDKNIQVAGTVNKCASDGLRPGRGAFCISGAVLGTLELKCSFSQPRSSRVIFNFFFNWVWFPLSFIKEAEIILKSSPKYLSKSEAIVFIFSVFTSELECNITENCIKHWHVVFCLCISVTDSDHQIIIIQALWWVTWHYNLIQSAFHF